MEKASQAPCTGSLIGSWLIGSTTTPDQDDAFIKRQIYHVAADEKTHWETHYGNGQVSCSTLGYRFTDSALTICYPSGREDAFQLKEEDERTLCFLGTNGHWWWMRRLAEPLADSRVFVGTDGVFSRLGKSADAANIPSS